MLHQHVFEGVEFDEELWVQGFDYPVVIDLRDLIVIGRTKVGLTPQLIEWIDRECAGEAILATERDDFLIAFNNPADALLYKIRATRN